MTKHDNFKEAFDMGTGGCVDTCLCGRVFYNPDYSWSWGDGELEGLNEDPAATAIDYAVPRMRFGGKEYLSCCDCWHESAKKYMAFIDSHAHEIAKYLTLEKQRKTDEAKNAPTVG